MAIRIVLVGIILGCGLAGRATASEAYGVSETLAGWSDDGERYAVIVAMHGQGSDVLVVREHDKVLATLEGPDPSEVYNDGPVRRPKAKHPAPDRIDVEKYAALTQYRLKKIDAAARKRFAAGFELVDAGKQIGNRYECKGSGWTLRRKGDPASMHEMKAQHGECLSTHGGYLHPLGTRVLVKFTSAGYTPAKDDGGNTQEDTRFVLIDVPAAAPKAAP